MALVIFAALFVAAGAVWAWTRLRRNSSSEPAPAKVSLDQELTAQFKPEWGDADVYVSMSRRLWPSLKANPFFWAGICTSTMICFLGFMGASALAQGVLGITLLFCGAFILANLVQAAVAVLGDHGKGEWYEFKAGDRPAWHWPVLAALLLVNFVASITGSSNVAEVLQTTSEINVSSLESRKSALARAEGDLEALRTRRLQEAPGFSSEALQAKATETEQASEREAGRGGCGRKCETLKSDAIKWRSLANDSIRERKLGDQIAVMRSDLSDSAADGTARTVASPHAKLVEEVTGGAVTKRQVNEYLSPLFWLLISIVDIALWLWAGDYAGRYRMEQYRIRAEAANAWLTNAGLPARYKITAEGIVEDTKALTGPNTGPGDTININLSKSAEAQIQASPRLLQIQHMFDSVLIRSDGNKIAIGRAYELFAKIRSEQGERHYMNQPDFRASVTTYCELMGIELVSNQIIGFKIGLSQTQIVEAAE